jgi:hypothetical protein
MQTGHGGDPSDRALPVFIVHWKSPDSCAATVAALRAQTVPLRITIIDNGSPREMLSKLAPLDCPIERLEENVGYGPALNHALARWLAAESDAYALVCPHDALPKPDCVARIIAAMAERPRAGLASAEYGRDTLPGYSFLWGYDAYPAVRGSGWSAAEFPNGTLFAVSRRCLREIGLFDARYFAYGEEYELGLRALRAGWEVGQVWGAVVDNPLRVASSSVTWYLIIRNGLLATRQRDGLSAAFLRSSFLAAAGVKSALARRTSRSSAPLGIRLRAIQDFWRGRFGPPPRDL